MVLGIAILGFFGLTVVNPNEAKVVQLFGSLQGLPQGAGLLVGEPVDARAARVSLRVRNFESSKLKVNDQDGNPIEIAAVVVWQVVDTAEAVFQVDDYENFVHVQSESALRNLATRYPYDAHREGEMSLRMSVIDIAHQLRDEIQERLAKAGVEVIEARITHLAYAPEIASAMLRRQQAGAIIAARQKIVEGAVGMVEMALEQLSAQAGGGTGRGAQGEHGEQPAGGAVQRARRPADRQHGNAVSVEVTAWRNGNHFCSGWTRRRTRRCSAGRTPTCAA